MLKVAIVSIRIRPQYYFISKYQITSFQNTSGLTFAGPRFPQCHERRYGSLIPIFRISFGPTYKGSHFVCIGNLIAHGKLPNYLLILFGFHPLGNELVRDHHSADSGNEAAAKTPIVCGFRFAQLIELPNGRL
jgi:hypothetical protein